MPKVIIIKPISIANLWVVLLIKNPPIGEPIKIVPRKIEGKRLDSDLVRLNLFSKCIETTPTDIPNPNGMKRPKNEAIRTSHLFILSA